jgi:hypothetical protein
MITNIHFGNVVRCYFGLSDATLEILADDIELVALVSNATAPTIVNRIMPANNNALPFIVSPPKKCNLKLNFNPFIFLGFRP